MGKAIRASILLSVLATVAQGATIATFADPAANGTTPLFSVAGGTITGGWDDSLLGLTLVMPTNSATFTDAWFDMTPLPYTGTLAGAVTGAGTIRFFADGQNTTPLLQFDFESASLSFRGLGGDNIFSANVVTLSGSEVNNMWIYDNESFTFAFANQVLGQNTLTATASFTSSADISVPEPATLSLLGLAGLSFARRRR